MGAPVGQVQQPQGLGQGQQSSRANQHAPAAMNMNGVPITYGNTYGQGPPTQQSMSQPANGWAQGQQPQQSMSQQNQPFNLQQSVVQGMQQAGQTSAQGTNFQAPQLSNTNLQAYQNPFESQVVDQSLQDLERSRLMQQNQMGASATQAKAFGGSRHGIAEAETNRGFADQAARTASQLRAGGFENAQNMAQDDLQRQMQAQQYRQQAAGQLGQQAVTGYDMSRDISNQMQQQGELNQANIQALIDASRDQYGGFQGAPMQGAAMMVDAQPNIRTGDNTITDTTTPGLLEYGQMAASVYNPGGVTGALKGLTGLFGKGNQGWTNNGNTWGNTGASNNIGFGPTPG